MNKKIIGISVATLFAASGALAQTSVTVYGTLDAGIAYQDGTAAEGKKVSLESGQQSYSRIGFRGTEDLGNNMKAIFVLEQGVQIDTGSSGYATLGSGIIDFDPFTEAKVPANKGIFSSQAYVGVSSGNFGTVTLGRQLSPLYESYMAIDPFKNGFAANINSTFGSTSKSVSLYQRMDNAAIYHTPDNLYGFKGALAYSFGEQAGAISAQSQVGVSLGYANGPLTIVYAYHHANNDHATLKDPVAAFQTNFIGATYDFGAVKIHGAFDQNKQGNDFKNEDYLIGVTVPFGSAHSVFADYIFKKDKINTNANAKQFGIGYTYNLSKRTNLYAAYTHIKNDGNATIGTNVSGNTVNTFQIGVRHMF